MAGKSASADAPAAASVPPAPLSPFSVISGGVACVLTVIRIGLKVPGLRRYRVAR